MRAIILVNYFLFFIIVPTLFAQKNPETEKVLKNWIYAHNSGELNQIENFIKEFYAPKRISDKLLSKHGEFYYHAFEMYGELNVTPHKILENNKLKFVAQFTRKLIPNGERLKPENIVQIEIELNENGKLEKSIGIAALACYLSK